MFKNPSAMDSHVITSLDENLDSFDENQNEESMNQIKLICTDNVVVTITASRKSFSNNPFFDGVLSTPDVSNGVCIRFPSTDIIGTFTCLPGEQEFVVSAVSKIVKDRRFSFDVANFFCLMPLSKFQYVSVIDNLFLNHRVDQSKIKEKIHLMTCSDFIYYCLTVSEGKFDRISGEPDLDTKLISNVLILWIEDILLKCNLVNHVKIVSREIFRFIVSVKSKLFDFHTVMMKVGQQKTFEDLKQKVRDLKKSSDTSNNIRFTCTNILLFFYNMDRVIYLISVRNKFVPKKMSHVKIEFENPKDFGV